MNWLLYHYVMTSFVSCDNYFLKEYLIWHSIIILLVFFNHCFWKIFVFLFIFGVVDLCCCVGFFSSSGEWGMLSLQASHCRVWVLGAWGSVVVAHGFTSCSSWTLEHRLSSCGTHGLSSSTACGIFPDQGSNLCLLYWQVDSLPVSHQGSPIHWVLIVVHGIFIATCKIFFCFICMFVHVCPIKWMCTSSAFLSIQASGVERRKLRLPLKRVFLWQCHRQGLPRNLHLLRRLTPVKCVVQSWEAFSIWLSSREHNTARNYWSVGHVPKDFLSVQTLSSTRSSTSKKNHPQSVWTGHHLWRVPISMCQGSL